MNYSPAQRVYSKEMNSVMADSPPEKEYSLKQITGIWLAATLPPVVVTWVLVPRLLYLTLPAVELYWLMVPLSAAAQLALAAWLVRREEGAWTWAAIKRRLRLNLPRSPSTDEPGVRSLWSALPWALLLAFTTLVSMVLVTVTPLMYLSWPPYAASVELASPIFAGQWGWLVLIPLLWASGVCAEECLFRGVLLPRMRGVFGRRHGLANGVLYGLYHLYKPWAIPFRLLESVAIVRPARKCDSTVISIAVRGAEGLFVLGFLLVGVLAPIRFRPLPAQITEPLIARQPAPASSARVTLTELPAAANGVRDLRGYNLAKLDLHDAGPALSMARFDDRTRWPDAGHMPADFNHRRILELGKNPGLGVRQLHAAGITGRDVGIAILDTPLLASHEEYRDRLAWYEEIDTRATAPAQMHSGAVASIAVGRTSGVAPEARLYFIGIDDLPVGVLRRYSDRALGIRRLLEINRRLAPERRIRVISMSMGWAYGSAGYYDLEAAVREARAAGIFVVSANMGELGPFLFHGLGRPALADPDLAGSYEPGLFWQSGFYKGRVRRDHLLIPMDSRTTASPTGNQEYVFYRNAGWSWSIPYIAGVYALAVQVDPAITPERFWAAAVKTGRVISLEHSGREMKLGPIIDPPALIASLERQ